MVTLYKGDMSVLRVLEQLIVVPVARTIALFYSCSADRAFTPACDIVTTQACQRKGAGHRSRKE